MINLLHKKSVAIITARGKSKGLPRKNIIDLAGKPLIAWTIEASLNSRYISKTIVSSDDEEILDISKKYGAEIIRRPDNLANDTATSESAVKHAIDFLKSIGEEFDIIVLLQPTSPLRTSKDIDKAFEAMSNSSATAVISMYKYDSKILKAFTKKSNGFLQGVSDNKSPFMRRQDLPVTYMGNGAIYIIMVSEFMKKMCFLTDRTAPYIMDVTKSLDIDTFSDAQKASDILLKSV
jgi:CMP-N,N'-diacetyllegionaminic acid synthase